MKTRSFAQFSDEPCTYSGEEGFPCREGFARITRAGITDIYIVQNQEYPGDYKVSLAFYMDDFEPGDTSKKYGEPLVLGQNERIQFLGSAKEYFVSKEPGCEERLQMVRLIPKSAGLLPAVRAIEHLHQDGVKPTQDARIRVARHYLDEYYRRRLLLK